MTKQKALLHHSLPTLYLNCVTGVCCGLSTVFTSFISYLLQFLNCLTRNVLNKLCRPCQACSWLGVIL